MSLLAVVPMTVKATWYIADSESVLAEESVPMGVDIMKMCSLTRNSLILDCCLSVVKTSLETQ